MRMARDTIGRIPFLAMGSGPPMVFVGGLSFSGGVDAAGTEKMATSMVKPGSLARREKRRGTGRSGSVSV